MWAQLEKGQSGERRKGIGVRAKVCDGITYTIPSHLKITFSDQKMKKCKYLGKLAAVEDAVWTLSNRRDWDAG